MKCPHCDMEIQLGQQECPWCGLIFSKWRAAQSVPAEPLPPRPQVQGRVALVWSRITGSNLLPPLVVALVPAAWAAAAFPGWMPVPDGWYSFEQWLFPLSFCDLAVHEAGHVVFRLGGSRFLTVLGGTLMQLIMPGLFFGHFYRQRHKWGMAFTLFWLGFALGDISYYMSDAKEQVLILLGGVTGRESGTHDWHYLLGRLGLLDHSMKLGALVMFAGAYVMAFGVLFPFFVRPGAAVARKDVPHKGG
ncbi:MAG: hypothetical protein PHW69_04985 [Elusimicrobiaceae bacterium]|nr:hypothetical protein [Elusimicrobiaceae bacterium]